MTRSETETTFRWDLEELVLWGCTSDPAVARRWRKLGLPVGVLWSREGKPSTWEVKVAADRWRWRRAMSVAVPPSLPSTRFSSRRRSVPPVRRTQPAEDGVQPRSGQIKSSNP